MADEDLPAIDPRRQYEALIDLAADAIFLADADTGTIVEANDAASTLLDRPQDDIVGSHHTDLHPPGEADRYRRLFERHAYGDGDREPVSRFADGSDVCVVTGDDERIPVEINARPIRVDERTLLQGIFRDISERRERERDLRTFERAVEQAAHAIYILEDDGTIAYANPASEDITGYATEELVGENLRILQSDERDEPVSGDRWERIHEGEIWEEKFLTRRNNGEQYVIEQTIAPITDPSGEIERFVAVHTDVTERDERERALKRQNERLEEFARTLAHDLRNPLNVAQAHLELARSTDEETHFENVERAHERIDELIEENLALARQGMTVDDPETVSLGAVVRRAWDGVATPEATLSLAFEESDAASVRADPSRFQELLENLVRNAIDHGGDDVTVTVGELDQHAGFYVADDGPGIPREKRDEVFETGVTTREDGTGFGLAIVREIAAAHDWGIDVTRSDQGGARFEFTVPEPDWTSGIDAE